MERLTEKRDGKNVIPLRNAITGIDVPYWKLSRANELEAFLYGAAADKLAAYEDGDSPAADVVEVVRCRECTFWDTSWNPGVGVTGEAHYCPRCHLVTLKDSFCSGACRKDGGQDDAG